MCEFRIEGVATVLPFHRAVVRQPDFVGTDGFKVHTRWIETDFTEPLAAAVRGEPDQTEPLHRTAIEIDGRRVSLGLPALLLRGLSTGAGAEQPAATAPAIEKDPAAVTAPLAGTLQAWKAEDGAEVTEGETVAVMEAMKMEMQVIAHRSGRLVRC